MKSPSPKLLKKFSDGWSLFEISGKVKIDKKLSDVTIVDENEKVIGYVVETVKNEKSLFMKYEGRNVSFQGLTYPTAMDAYFFIPRFKNNILL